MRTFTLFYAWQSDHPSDIGKNFIDQALKAAAQAILETRQIIVVIDADTRGVSGTPPVSETILAKIDACDAFLADFSLVASTPAGKASPNPNALIEYGYALKALGPHHLILAMNTAFGGPDALPFDLRHLRHPLQYAAEAEITDGERRRRRARFADQLVVALNGVIDRPPPRKRGPSPKTPDLKAPALKRLTEFKSNRIAYGVAAHVRLPRVVLDIYPLAALAGHRLDLEAVKAARPWFSPGDDDAAEPSTRHGQWISRGPATAGQNFINPVSLWATRLIAPGHLERAFSVGRAVTRRSDQVQDGPEFDWTTINALRRSGELLDAIALGGPAFVSLGIEGCEDLRLGQGDAYGSPLGLHAMAFEPVLVDDLRRPDPAQVRPLLNDVWQAAGWDEGTPSISSAGWSPEIEARE